MSSLNPSAGVIVVGNEILSGQTQDLNIFYLTKNLFNLGIEVKEVRVILDDEDQIIGAVRSFHEAYDFVFTTGGIGPTHDDITSHSVAKAFHLPLIKHPEALRRLYEKYPQPKAPEAMERMALIPEGAELIDNPISAAPGFRIYNVHVMAGIPDIMQKMFESLMPHLKKGTPRHSIKLIVSGAEGMIAEGLRTIQRDHPAIEIGSYPKWSSAERSVMVVAKGFQGNDLEQVRAELLTLFQSLDLPVQEAEN
jgi:molybdenum cofactor synthesis domain-containing protein